MRTKIIGLTVFLCLSLFVIQQVFSAAGILQRLGIDEDIACESVVFNFTSSSWSIPIANVLKKVALGDRGAVVKELGEYVKAYTKTEAFRQAYLEDREQRKPSPPEPMDSMEDMKAKQKAAMEEGIRNAEKMLSSMPPETREGMSETIDQMRDQLKEIDNPDNPMFSPEMDKNIRQIQVEQNQRYAEELKQWEAENPASPKKMILEKLKAFMAVSENIDFGAKLIPGYGSTMKFENPLYEEMPYIRKMCFRAGKDAVDSIRSFTQEWIKEIESELE